MNVLLWVLQVLLAVVFIAHGLLLLMPPRDIAAQMLMSLPRWFWVFLGVAEVAAAMGLTLPGLTRVMPWLVSWAAAGIIIVMISATGYHIIRGEISSAAVTFVLLIMATFLAYERSQVLPIAPRKSHA
jgi:putative oxidoreductase